MHDFILFYFFTLFWEGGGDPKQAPSWQCRARCGFDLTNHKIMTWAETKSWMLNRLNHPGTPSYFFPLDFQSFGLSPGLPGDFFFFIEFGRFYKKFYKLQVILPEEEDRALWSNEKVRWFKAGSHSPEFVLPSRMYFCRGYQMKPWPLFLGPGFVSLVSLGSRKLYLVFQPHSLCFLFGFLISCPRQVS